MDPDVLSSDPWPSCLHFLVFSPCIWSWTVARLAVSAPCVYQNKMNFYFYLSFIFSYVNSRICHKKRKGIKNHLFHSTLYDRHHPVQVFDIYGMTRYESFTHTPQPHIIRRTFTSSAVRILNFIRHCFAYKMNGNTTRMVRCVRIIVTLWVLFSFFIHSFNHINRVWFVGDIFLSLP